MQTFQLVSSDGAVARVKTLTNIDNEKELEAKLDSLGLGESVKVTDKIIIVRNEHQIGFRVVVK